MPHNNMIVLGRLARPHSIRGEIRVDYFAESPLLLEKPLMLKAGRLAPRPVSIVSWRMWKDVPIIRLEGVEDRTRAEAMRGQELLIDARHLPDAEPEEPYIHDILDLPVFLSGGDQIGVLEDVIFPADQEIWVIRTADAQEILFPAVPDYVNDIDLDAERIDISPPPGLLEIYLSSQK